MKRNLKHADFAIALLVTLIFLAALLVTLIFLYLLLWSVKIDPAVWTPLEAPALTDLLPAFPSLLAEQFC